METNQRLSDRMRSISMYGPSDPRWDQFVRDHKEWIKAKCTLRKFKPEEILQWRYKPADFYADNGGSMDVAWVFMLLNNIASPMEFHEGRTQWYFPPYACVQESYAQYVSIARSTGIR